MPKNVVDDLITDQEITFARLVLAGNMTDQQAAETAGLNPTSAAYTKAKPRVRAWMAEYRAATMKQLLEEEAANRKEQQRDRERVMASLWRITDLHPEATRNNVSGQVKALTMIVAILGLIPNRFNTQPKPAPSFTPVVAAAHQPQTEPAPTAPFVMPEPLNNLSADLGDLAVRACMRNPPAFEMPTGPNYAAAIADGPSLYKDPGPLTWNR